MYNFKKLQNFCNYNIESYLLAFINHTKNIGFAYGRLFFQFNAIYTYLFTWSLEINDFLRILAKYCSTHFRDFIIQI